MLIQNFEWFLKGTNENGQKIEMTLDSKTVQRLINMLYAQSPDTTGMCETCNNFNQCFEKIFDANCTQYEEIKA